MQPLSIDSKKLSENAKQRTSVNDQDEDFYSIATIAKQKKSWGYPAVMFCIGCVLSLFLTRNFAMVGLVAFACSGAYITNILAACSRYQK